MKLVSLFILATWISGCASVLTIRGESLKSNTDTQIDKYICTDYAIQVVWRNHAIGQVFESSSEKKNLNKYEKREFDQIKNELNKIMNEKCKQNVRVLIEVIHEPINENRVLLLTNAVTFGIVPYWGDYLNKVNMKIYSEGTLLSSASTEIVYRRIQSIFLWPIAIFSDTGNFDISQKVIPMHFNNISEIVRKNDGLK